MEDKFTQSGDVCKEIDCQINSGQFVFDDKKLNHTHECSIGNLCDGEIEKEMERFLGSFRG